MAEGNNERPFMEVEDELNNALSGIGKNRESKDNSLTIDDKIAALTVQELLEKLTIDEFEKIYITTAAQSASPTKEQISDDKLENVKTLAEYELSNRDLNEEISVEEQNKLKAASNFYLIPHTVNQKYAIGNEIQTKQVDLYTVNDVEGYSLYTVIDNNISMSNGFRKKIEDYMKENYESEINSGLLKIDDVVEYFTPNSMEEIYEKLGDERIISMRFLPDRIDEYARSKGIFDKKIDAIGDDTRETNLDQHDNLLEENKVALREEPEQKQEKESVDELEEEPGKVRDDASVRLEEDKDEPVYESYIEKIAKLNHVKPAVVNTRVVENFEKVEEDTGIPLKGRYPRGEVIAVRIPYKLGYRTFLVEKSTGMTIDGKGRMERKTGRLYDYDEIEDYFRFKLRNGADGGESGKPLRYDEGRDYTTYIDEHGDVKEKKFINNGKKQDMLREERERYLAEVEEADQKLKEAIEDYQKHATRENYEKVREIIKEKVEIDNKYNALDEQREVTQETKENTERVIERDLDDDDGWFPSPPGERFR